MSICQNIQSHLTLLTMHTASSPPEHWSPTQKKPWLFSPLGSLGGPGLQERDTVRAMFAKEEVGCYWKKHCMLPASCPSPPVLHLLLLPCLIPWPSTSWSSCLPPLLPAPKVPAPVLFPRQSQIDSASSCSFPSQSQGKSSGCHCPLPAGPLHLVGHPERHHLAPPPGYHTFPEHLTSSHGNSFWKHLPIPAPPLLSTATPPNLGWGPSPNMLSANPVSPFSLLFKMLLDPLTPLLPRPHTPFFPFPACPLLSSVSPCFALTPQSRFLQGLGLPHSLPSSNSPGLSLPPGNLLELRCPVPAAIQI